MSFEDTRKPRTSILATWKPGRGFDPENDRLLVHTMWDELVILRWSSLDPHKGEFMLDPDTMPASIKRRVDEFKLLDPVSAGQPQLLAYQDDADNLCIRLAHPYYEWSFTILHEIGVVESADLTRSVSVYARAASSLAVRGGGGPIKRVSLSS